MKKLTLITVGILVILIGCKSIDFVTIDNFLDRKSSRGVLLKKDRDLLDGPYRIIDRVSSEKIIAEKDKITYIIYLRGCTGLGVAYDNLVSGSYYEDLGLYLLKECSLNLATNQIKAVIYQPANQVYIGMPDGFDNLTYVMPQLTHIAYGKLKVDHSDTNYPLYRVFCDAEYLAKRFKQGYWADHKE